MAFSSPSALITDQGTRVLLRLEGKFYELSQASLRQVLGLPDGPPGLGITVDRDRFRFEFVTEDCVIELTAAQLRRRLAKRTASKS